MKIVKTNIILFSIVVIVVLFFIAFRAANRLLERHVSTEMQKIKDELLETEKAKAIEDEKKMIKQALVSDDLSPYMITAQRKSNLFKNQQYWDIETRKAIGQPRIISGIQQGDVFKGKLRSPKQLQEQIDRIESRIKAYKKKIRDNPNDNYARQKLQDLYMLKSTVRIVGENVISKE